MSHKPAKGQQPEALATFAEAARHGGRKPGKVGLTATPETAPIPVAPRRKQDAATKVLQEGVTGRDKGAEAAVDALPDRTAKGRKG